MSSLSFEAQRFHALWRRCVASPPSPDPVTVYVKLHGLLGGPDRRYHGLEHIADCIRRSDDVAALVEDPDAVELALWFHDANYTPGDAGNERRSAELFLSLTAGAQPRFRLHVCRLILATRHKAPPHGHDASFVVDIDLSGFGASWDEFMRKGALLREEFGGMTDAQYHAAQIPFLRGLERRKHIFATDYFRSRCETRARQNLHRLLQTLEAQGYRTAAVR